MVISKLVGIQVECNFFGLLVELLVYVYLEVQCCNFYVGIVYWLDWVMIGVVFVVKYRSVLWKFNWQFVEKDVCKIYFVVVDQLLLFEQGILYYWLEKDWVVKWAIVYKELIGKVWECLFNYKVLIIILDN